MAFVPMEEENGRVGSDMSSISRRTNSSCSNSSSNTIPSIIHRARHFLSYWVILILQLGHLKLGVDAQSHTGNTQHSQDSSSGLARFQHLQFSAPSHCWVGIWLSCLAQQAHRAIPHFSTQLPPRGSVSRAIVLYLKWVTNPHSI